MLDAETDEAKDLSGVQDEGTEAKDFFWDQTEDLSEGQAKGGKVKYISGD